MSKMTKKDVYLIKHWRINGCSWRRIAELATEKWPDRDYISGHQLTL